MYCKEQCVENVPVSGGGMDPNLLPRGGTEGVNTNFQANVMFLLVPPAQHEAFSLCDNLNLSHHLSIQHVQYVIGHIFVEISPINVYKAV